MSDKLVKRLQDAGVGNPVTWPLRLAHDAAAIITKQQAEIKALRAQVAQAEGDHPGTVRVPKEPTREMWAAMGTAYVNIPRGSRGHDHVCEQIWLAALSAASEGEG